MLTIFCSLQVRAATTYQILGLKHHLRDNVYLLKNKTSDVIVLDCSSFIHNLTITTNQQDEIHYLTVQECVDYYNFFTTYNFRRKCLTNDHSEIVYHHCR